MAAVARDDIADVVSDTVRRVAGHEPEALSEWLRRNPESYAHLRAP